MKIDISSEPSILLPCAKLNVEHRDAVGILSQGVDIADGARQCGQGRKPRCKSRGPGVDPRPDHHLRARSVACVKSCIIWDCDHHGQAQLAGETP